MGNQNSQQQQQYPPQNYNNRRNNYQRPPNRKPISQNPQNRQQQIYQKHQKYFQQQQKYPQPIAQPLPRQVHRSTYSQQQQEYLNHQFKQNNRYPNTPPSRSTNPHTSQLQYPQTSQRQPKQYYNEQYTNYENDYNNNTSNAIIEQYDFRNLTIHNVNDKMQKFDEFETQQQEEFELEQERRRRDFENEKKKRRDLFDKEIQLFENSNYDPYKVLGLNRNHINTDMIKRAYKHRAVRYHPDKNGDPEMFKIITQSYCYLMNKYGKAQEFEQKITRDVTNQEYEPRMLEGYENVHISKDNFNINKFNEIFEKFRIDDEYDDGYGNIMDKGNRKMDNDDFLSQQRSIFDNRSFNKDIFNKTFASEKIESEEIIEYQEPQALNSSTQSNYRELGKGKIDDFTGNNDTNQLGYTDYKHAYGKHSKFIDPDKVKYKEYKSLNDLKADRSNISHTMSREDEKKYKMKKQREEEKERRRLERVKNRDDNYLKQFEKLNQIFIKN